MTEMVQSSLETVQALTKELPTISERLSGKSSPEEIANKADKADKADKIRRFPVVEIFGPTVQGEGSVIGLQTIFVRFGGCDYRCERCDSLHAVLPKLIKENATAMSSEEIVDFIVKTARHCKLVTFSGGNPCMHDLHELILRLKANGFSIALETQGTIWRDWISMCDWITVSPKGPGMGEKFEPEKFDMFMSLCRKRSKFAIKFIIFDQRDIQFAVDVVARWKLQDTDMIYLSVGNPWPPEPAIRNDAPKTMRDALCERMTSLMDDVFNERFLQNAKFLPQLHVLLWGNEQGR